MAELLERDKAINYGQREMDRVAGIQGKPKPQASSKSKDPMQALLSAEQMLGIDQPKPEQAGSDISPLGFAKDVATNTINNFGEKGLVGGMYENTKGMGNAIYNGALTTGKAFADTQLGIANKALPFLFGKDGAESVRDSASELANKAGTAFDSTVGKLDELTTNKPKSETEEAAPATAAAAADQPVEGELMPAGAPVGLNGSFRPNGRFNINDYMENAPDKPFKDVLSMETGIDANSLPGGAFGGLNALNAAMGAMLPAVQANKNFGAQYERARELMGTDIEQANDMAERSKPIIKMQTLPDGREIPVVMNSNGQRLDPTQIDPQTGLPMLMMSQSEMLASAKPLMEQLLANKDLSKEAKRSRLAQVIQPMIDAGYEPPNIDEML